MSSCTILKNGRVIDPSQNADHDVDVFIKDGVIVDSGAFKEEQAEVVNVEGKWVVPGLIDMHVHLREPGEEYKETIQTGTRAAAAGGFTGVACMPNTQPVNDKGSTTEFICERARGCDAKVYPVGAISMGLKGEALAEYGEIKRSGGVAVSDDGMPVVNSQLMRRALEYGASHGMLVISHAEELSLARGGCMNEGELSTRMGLKGIPAVAESIMVQRDISLAECTGARLHIAHVSTELSLRVIRDAKERGVRVTAETAPHYFTLTDEAVSGYNTNAKMNPPLRSKVDCEAVKQALEDGTLDAIATDHAPHSILEKEVEFNFAANGIMGLETSLALSLGLVRDGILTPARLIELMSCNPAKILGVQGGSLAVGNAADITVIDPDQFFDFDVTETQSLGANSPFDGWRLQGRALLTMLDGRITCRHG